MVNKNWMIRRDWQQMEQTLREHSPFSSEAASSLRISQDVKILPSKRLFLKLNLFVLWEIDDSIDYDVLLHVFFFKYMQKVLFISEDLALECEGKDKFKCGSNVFWKWWRTLFVLIQFLYKPNNVSPFIHQSFHAHLNLPI